MFSKDSARQADACRFCWMCRHICPVAGSTGNEGWTPRARGLMISMIERGTEYDAEIAETMYHCTLCDACANDCATGYKPSEFIREARTLAVVENKAPEAVMKCIETIEECGNIFGYSAANKMLDQIGSIPEKSEILLFVGQTSSAGKCSTAVSFAKLMKKAGVEFTVLRDEPSSGAYMGELMGITGDVQAIAEAAAERIIETGAKKLVVVNPADAAMFRDQYSNWGLLKDVEIVTATAFAAELFESGKLKPISCEMSGSLQEPVKLTRGLDEIEPAKKLIEAAGVDFNELFLHGKMSRCIGTVPFDMYAPDVVKLMVKTRCEDALRLGSKRIFTVSPDDNYIMSKYALEEVEIVDLFKVLADLC